MSFSRDKNGDLVFLGTVGGGSPTAGSGTTKGTQELVYTLSPSSTPNTPPGNTGQTETVVVGQCGATGGAKFHQISYNAASNGQNIMTSTSIAPSKTSGLPASSYTFDATTGYKVNTITAAYSTNPTATQPPQPGDNITSPDKISRFP